MDYVLISHTAGYMCMDHYTLFLRIEEVYVISRNCMLYSECFYFLISIACDCVSLGKQTKAYMGDSLVKVCGSPPNTQPIGSHASVT